MKKVLITGTTGFIGQNLINYLGNNYIYSYYKRKEKIDIKEDYVIHLAGKAHDLKEVANPDEYYLVNFELTRALYNAFLKSEAKKFIFISSVKAVADSIEEVLTEASASCPQTDYGKSKMMAEKYIQSQPLPIDKLYYILRPCMIHGPGNKGNLNLLYNFVSKGIPYPLAAFLNKRSFLSIDNLCFIIKEILEREDIPSGIYNVADDESLSTKEVINLLAQAQNRSTWMLNIPKNLISSFAKLGDKLLLPLTTERLQKLTENFVVSNQKIKNALKKELPISASEGILKTARSFKKQ